MIEELMNDETEVSNTNVNVREMQVRTDPLDEKSPTIKRKFLPLDNPGHVLDFLKGVTIIKEGVIGNNITTGPNQYASRQRKSGHDDLPSS